MIGLLAHQRELRPARPRESAQPAKKIEAVGEKIKHKNSKLTACAESCSSKGRKPLMMTLLMALFDQSYQYLERVGGGAECVCEAKNARACGEKKEREDPL